mgnify:CR=1 FL=1
MNQFGVAAVNAAILLQQNATPYAECAWNRAIGGTNFKSSTREKVCPREAFIGLAQSGCILGVAPIPSSTMGLNALYAIVGAGLLRNGNAPRPSRKGEARRLWSQVLKVLGIKKKSYNSQMNVVLALWDANLI